MRYKILKVLSKILFVLVIICAVFVLLLNLNVVSLNDIVEPVAITLNQNEIGIKKGKTYQLEATVEPANAKFGSYIWESSDPSVAVVNETTGYITAKNYGDCVITVKTELGDVISNCLVHVSNRDVFVTDLKLESEELSLAVGKSKSINFSIVPPNGTTNYYIYKSSDNSIAVVNENGIIKALSPGNCIITVENKINGAKDSLKLNVYKVESGITSKTNSTITYNPTIPVVSTQVSPSSLKVNKEEVTIKTGSKITLVPTITPDNAIKEVNWSSSDSKIATVDKNGIVTGIKNGTCTVVCTTVNGLSYSTDIIVANSASEKPGIYFASKTLDVKVGDLQTLDVQYYLVSASTNVIWESSNDNVVAVNNGVIHAAKEGAATITATAGNYSASVTVYVGVQETVIKLKSITFDKSSYSCFVGDTIPINTSLTPQNTTEWFLTWTTSNRNIATVSNGTVKCMSPGVTNITAQGGTTTNSVQVTVDEVQVQSVILTENISIKLDESELVTAKILPENATNSKITWTSSDTDVFTVSSYGLIEGVSKGTATLTGTSSNGKQASVKVTIQ